MRTGIFIYDGAEVLDFAGPFEVFTTAARVSGVAPFEVIMVAEHSGVISARGGLQVHAHYGLDNCPTLDVLIVAGGLHDPVLTKPQVLNWFNDRAPQLQLLASVCTGVFILAETGLITGRAVTTHWEDQAALAARHPDLEVKNHVRWVDDGFLVTSGGISSGIDMSLYLIARLLGTEVAEATAQQMEYQWRQND